MDKVVKLFILLLILSIFGVDVSWAEAVDRRLAGYVVLQVEENGEAWYVHPGTLSRYYLGRPEQAFRVMREQGVGISNADISRIPVGLTPRQEPDRDGDGLSDELETALGSNPGLMDSDNDGYNDLEELKRGFNLNGSGQVAYDPAFARRQAGRIFLQVQSHGEAWYVYPRDNKRYYLGRPADAFSLMRGLGLGVSNADLGQVPARTPAYNLSSLEAKVFDLVNDERQQAGLERLKWNDELAFVARGHSDDLARENSAFTELGRTCDFPLIHHEGLNGGLYNSQRLANSGHYYYSRTGENIALVASASYSVVYRPGSRAESELEECDSRRHRQEQQFLSALDKAEADGQKIAVLEQELSERQAAYQEGAEVEIKNLNWRDEDDIARDTVAGWMDSRGHRANILTPEFNEAGLGIARVNGYVISTQVFIERADCGYRYGVCCQKEGYYPYCYNPYTCENNICR